MVFNINDFGLTLDKLFGEGAKFPLMKVVPWIDHDTKVQQGWKYTVASEELFSKFPVKVKEASPVITNEELMRSSSRVYVAFANADVTFYGASLFEVKLSVTTTKVTIARNEVPAPKATAIKK